MAIAKLPKHYDNYVFDLYGTLMDIHTDESNPIIWEKLAFFYGYYDARYTGDEIKAAYESLIHGKEKEMQGDMLKAGKDNPRYAHEAFPELEITDVFQKLFEEKGVMADRTLAIHAGQFFRVMTMDYVRYYPGTTEMLQQLKKQGKGIYLLSNAQHIFTEYELHALDMAQYFDGIMISSDYGTKKPDPRFFDMMMEKYDLQKEGTLFVGNDSKTDIAGAQSVGLDTFYVNSNISPEGDSADTATYQVAAFDEWGLN